jgi:biotin carboxyl carrier protein
MVHLKHRWTGEFDMQRYQIVVNGNTYNVTVKSITGNTAVVDVDGWEFQVAIAGDNGVTDFHPVIAAASASTASAMSGFPSQVPQKPAMPESGPRKKRTSVLEHLSSKKSSVPHISGAGVIVAHLPGQILEILVKVGETIKKGDIVCKMEAMKMVNEVQATRNGVVREILVREQQNVLENQPLMVIE